MELSAAKSAPGFSEERKRAGGAAVGRIYCSRSKALMAARTCACQFMKLNLSISKGG